MAFIVDECPVCYEKVELSPYHDNLHPLCSTCTQHLHSRNAPCPLCRTRVPVQDTTWLRLYEVLGHLPTFNDIIEVVIHIADTRFEYENELMLNPADFDSEEVHRISQDISSGYRHLNRLVDLEVLQFERVITDTICARVSQSHRRQEELWEALGL